MAITPKYYSLVPLKKAKDASNVQILNKPRTEDIDKGIANPIFNFNQSFINNLQAVSNTDMGQSVPYVRLRTVDVDGTIINDLNIEFFHKTLDMDTISNAGRLSDRPAMSLQDVTLTTDQPSGYLYYTKVDMRVRLHNPALLENNTLLPFLTPGAPLLLEYGWNSPDKFLNRKEHLLFQVVTYDLSLDTTGQVDIHVEGMAFNETFNNVFIGDDGVPVKLEQKTIDEIKVKNDGEIPPSEIQFSSLNAIKKRIGKMTEYLKNKKKNKESDVELYNIIKANAEVLQKVENRVRGILSKKYSQQTQKLKDKTIVETFGIGKKNKIKCYTFHDLVYNLCDETFKNMLSVFHPANVKTTEVPNETKREFRIIYGKFNDNAGKFAGKSIGDFPIDKDRFEGFRKKQIKNGLIVPTVGNFFNMIIANFFENPEYHMGFLKESERGEFKKPDVVVNMTNRGNIIEVQIIDTNGDFPITTSKFTTKNLTPASILKDIATEGKVPIILLGHAGSFIKNLTMSQISDQYMKAVLIERMNRDRISNLRSTFLPSQNLNASTVTPLTLPLRGSMVVLGHPEWKPFRAFFLSSGIYVIDAVYKILKVSHKISAEGFFSTIEFMYH